MLLYLCLELIDSCINFMSAQINLSDSKGSLKFVSWSQFTVRVYSTLMRPNSQQVLNGCGFFWHSHGFSKQALWMLGGKTCQFESGVH